MGLGPLGGGRIQHSFFNMQEAGVSFVNAVALEKYVNKAFTRLPGGAGGRQIRFQDEEHIFCHSDISFDNFLYDPATGRVWMVDFQHVNVLPRSFFSHYLHYSPWAGVVAKAVEAKLGFPRSPHLDLLALANALIGRSDYSSFGLDEYGEPMEPRQRRRRRVSAAKS
ncbi:Protein kinase-like domain [Mycena venus]|uniref:Protein kinase-like domain n=1 Tax=Mycena venus TaxID=2733690 RepID=A0A8H6WUH3_9AGAR|nr:Protein kinase-like domain [Mycena venus]